MATDELKALETQALGELQEGSDETALRAWNTKYFGDKGLVKSALGRLKDIPKDHRALSFRARLQHESRTLAMDEAAAVGQAIRDSLHRTLNASAR